jgi:hypothetical protein
MPPASGCYRRRCFQFLLALPALVLFAAQALLHSSHMFAEAKHSFASHGVLVDNPRVDIGAMMAQKSNAVTGLTKGIDGLFKKNKVGNLPKALYLSG